MDILAVNRKHFSNRGHCVLIIDNMIKKHWESQIGVSPLFNIEMTRQG